MSQSNALDGREIIIEFIPIGAYVRVTAMDVASMTEIFVQGPKTAASGVLRANALKRLEYVLRKNRVIA
ncbi:MAG: hypothetical protein H6865_06395 [Rhodospirillales bacterium]|nr:hypothetical protein [Rhodospirillales bacterium]USO07888.1 MAG: hypothetical protein H6866_01305 [Rhodospirillales bacterium]